MWRFPVACCVLPFDFGRRDTTQETSAAEERTKRDGGAQARARPPEGQRDGEIE